ncbi:MAG: chemotaxis-specific protein-glutamate methyltransferase CheB [Candidatus Rokuibacteriota bacterium]
MTAAPRVRVLVVEDSRFMRGVLCRLLASDPEIEVVGVADNGVDAVAASASLAPTVITMDVNMPHGDGLAAVERIMAERPTPIVMISSHTQAGSAAAIRALGLGAVDFVSKPSGAVDIGLGALRDEIVRKVKMAARIRPVRNAVATSDGRVAAKPPRGARRPGAETSWLPCVVIAASTGGPAALFDLVPALPSGLPASVLIAQHMPAPYTAHLAGALAERASLPVTEAEDGERLQRGHVYVVPGSHNALVATDGRVVLRAANGSADGVPSADMAMSSVARHAGRLSVGVVLTGMGRDGAEGAAAIRESGGLVLAQDEASSMVYGMPRAAAETGAVHMIVPLARLVDTLSACLRDLGTPARSLIHAS